MGAEPIGGDLNGGKWILLKNPEVTGQIVREKRRVADLSQSELARRLGYPNQSFVSKVEVGKARYARRTGVSYAC